MTQNIVKKIFYKLIQLNPVVDRFFRYRNPKRYWNQRGGDGYFQEQEAVLGRTFRSQFIGNEINKLDYQSLLEIGCGYGKQLKNFKHGEAFIAGCDFSRPQLLKARTICPEVSNVLVEADAEKLPYKSKSFDIVLSSAVILHNEYGKAQKMIAEMIRVGRKYIVHNEDIDITFSRYGYDMKKTYEKMNFKVLKSMPIEGAEDPSITQFTIVELTSLNQVVKPDQVLLQYH